MREREKERNRETEKQRNREKERKIIFVINFVVHIFIKSSILFLNQI
jgi:hypothetical protein